MKWTKRAAALMLSITMLIGLPLSVDVAAVTTGSEQFELLQATRMTEEIARAYTDNYASARGGDISQKGITLYFNALPGNNGSSYYVAAVNGSGEIKKTWDVSVAQTFLTRNENGSHMSTFHFWLKNDTWAVLDAAVATGGAYAGCTLKFILVEDNNYTEAITYAGVAANDGYVDDWYKGNSNFAAGAVNGAANAKTLFLKANTTYGADKRDAVMIDLEDVNSQFQIQSASLVGDDRVMIELNDPVSKASIEAHEFWTGLRIVDSNQNLLAKNAEGKWGLASSMSGTVTKAEIPVTNLFVSEDGLRVTGQIASYENTIGAYYNEIKQQIADGAVSISGVAVRFVLEEQAGNTTDDDMARGEIRKNWFIDTIWNAENQPLRANHIAPWWNGTAVTRTAPINDVFYISLTGAGTAEDILRQDFVLLESATVTSGKESEEVAFTFSEKIDNGFPRWIGLAVYDKDNNLVYMNADGDIKISAASGYSALQWALNQSGLGWRGRETLVAPNGFSANSAFGSFKTYKEIVGYLTEKGITEDKGYQIVFAVTETDQTEASQKANGILEKFYLMGSNGSKPLYANNVANGQDRATVKVTIAEAPLTMVVDQVSKHTMVVTFGHYDGNEFVPEAVTINDTILKPFIGLRMVTSKDELIRAARDNTGTTYVSLTTGQHMQWQVQEYKMLNDSQMLVTFPEQIDLEELMGRSNMPAALQDEEYQFKLCFEEMPQSSDGKIVDPDCVLGNGMVHAVASKENPLRQLVATRTGGRDGAYAAFDVLTDDDLIEIKNGAAIITGENELTFEWTEAVDVSNSTCAPNIRYVDPDNCMLWFYDAVKNELTHVEKYTDADGNEVKNTALQWGLSLDYVDAAKTKMTARIKPKQNFDVRDLDDLYNPAANSELAKVLALADGKFMVCLEENSAKTPAIVDTFFGVDNKTILAQPYIANWRDGVYIDIQGDVIKGGLELVKVTAIGDNKVVATFSAPVKVLSDPFTSIRLYTPEGKLLFWNAYTEEYTTVEQMYDADGNRVYKNQNGYTLEQEGYNAKGEWVNYAAQKNAAMQYATTWAYYNEEHTQIVYTVSGGAHLPAKNLTEMFAFDWDTVMEGSYVKFTIEENNEDMVINDGHVNNIVRADDPRIALDGNFFPHSRDSASLDVERGYEGGALSMTATIINDMQIRVRFSQPVDIEYAPHMAIRMIDKEGNLMWSGEKNKSVAHQYAGSWEWENDSHTSLIWTINGSGPYGANSLYEISNWSGALSKFKGEAALMFNIEELDKKDADGNYLFQAGRNNGLIDNIVSKDGTVHLSATYIGLDGILVDLNSSLLSGERLELLSVKATDDQTLEIKFNQGVALKEGDEAPSMAIRYLTASGDSEVLTDGKTAIFKGNWEYADETKTTILWKLDTKHADSLTDIFNYNGNLKWNKGARVAFVVMDANKDYYLPIRTNRINGVTDLNGYNHLLANYKTDDALMVQMDIEIGYSVPTVEAEPVVETIYVTNYIPYFIIGTAILVAGLIVAIVLNKKRNKNGLTREE